MQLQGLQLRNGKINIGLHELRIDAIEVKPFGKAHANCRYRRNAQPLAGCAPVSNHRSERFVPQIVEADINSRGEEKITKINGVLADMEMFAMQSQRQLQQDINKNRGAGEEPYLKLNFMLMPI